MTQFRNNFQVSERASSESQGLFIGTLGTLPTASQYNLGCTIQYTGAAGTYEPGRFYTCVQSGSDYEWIASDVLATILDLGVANKAVVTDASGKVIASSVTATEVGYLSGVGSGIQGQLDSKVPNTRVINGKALNQDLTFTLADFQNDAGFIQNTVNNLTNYYLKTETYTKAEVNELVGKLASFKSVDSLPQTGEENIIYLVPKAGSGNDVHDEYIYTDNQWELIGSTAVDLSNYYTKTEVDNKLITSGAFNSATNGNLTLTLSLGNGSTITVPATAITAAKAIADANGANIASTYATITALSDGLGGKADANTEITGGAFSNGTLTLNKASGNISISGFSQSETYTASRALVSDSSGNIAVSTVTSTELGYLDGVTSNVQTQLNNKADSSDLSSYLAKSGGTMTGTLTAYASTSYTRRQVRNVVMSTSQPSGGSNGDIWIVYE